MFGGHWGEWSKLIDFYNVLWGIVESRLGPYGDEDNDHALAH